MVPDGDGVVDSAQAQGAVGVVRVRNELQDALVREVLAVPAPAKEF